MWICPVCRRAGEPTVCKGCGFEAARDCETFPTLTKPTLADWRCREGREKKKPVSPATGKLVFGKGMEGWK